MLAGTGSPFVSCEGHYLSQISSPEGQEDFREVEVEGEPQKPGKRRDIADFGRCHFLLMPVHGLF